MKVPILIAPTCKSMSGHFLTWKIYTIRIWEAKIHTLETKHNLLVSLTDRTKAGQVYSHLIFFSKNDLNLEYWNLKSCFKDYFKFKKKCEFFIKSVIKQLHKTC